MSNASKINEYPTIADLFGLLDGWRHLPNYQLERRADIFFALFLPEVLENRCGIKIKCPLIPEFPIYKNENDGGHKYADYFVLSDDEQQGILVELKTDMASRVSCHGSKQHEILHDVASRGPRDLIKDVIWLAKNTNNSKPTRQKYVHLLSHLLDLNLVKFDPTLYEKAFAENSRGITKMLCNVEPTEEVYKGRPCRKVIYIQPTPDSDNQNVICFNTFSDVIVESDRGSKDIRQWFACYLRKWASEEERPGSVAPRTSHT